MTTETPRHEGRPQTSQPGPSLTKGSSGGDGDRRRALDGPAKNLNPSRATLPRWATWAALGGSAAVMAVLQLALGRNTALFLVGTALLTAVSTYTWSRVVEGPRKAVDKLMTVVVSSAFLLAMVPLVSLVYTVISLGRTRFDAAFFTQSMAGVLGAGGGIYHALMGTLIITGIATVIAVPVGLMTAIYLVEYAGESRLAKAVTFFVDVMTGIPSIVAGLFAYALFALLFGPGVRFGVVGAVALAVLMIPIVVRSTEEMLRVVPNKLREASFALGVPRWRTIVKVVLPTSIAGISAGITLAIARVMGETAPLLITVGRSEERRVGKECLL